VLAAREQRAPLGLAWRRLPEVVLTSVRDGSLRALDAEGRARLLARLAPGAQLLAPRERLLAYCVATRGADRGWRRATLARLRAT
jgi:hypothetical protein